MFSMLRCWLKIENAKLSLVALSNWFSKATIVSIQTFKELCRRVHNVTLLWTPLEKKERSKGGSLKMWSLQYRIHGTNHWHIKIRSVTNPAGRRRPAKQEQGKPTAHCDSNHAMRVLLPWRTGRSNYSALKYRELGGLYYEAHWIHNNDSICIK